MKHELVITKDGSSSIFLADLDEHYHSIHGAIQESLHVFINAGFKQMFNNQEVISILEIGFGTGLNTLLTCLESLTIQHKIEYTAIEKFPLTANIYSLLNYCNHLQHQQCTAFFKEINNCSWNESIAINEKFTLLKLNQDVQNIAFSNQFDIIYFDAFAPSAQPELWTNSIFKSMHQALKKEGVLVTYCAKGIVKRTLKEVGFIVETIPGPVGKREMTRAWKK